MPTVDERIKTAAGDAPLAMQFSGTSPEECRRWQGEFSAKLRALLGPFDPPAKWNCVLQRTVRLEDHTREERVLVAQGVPPVPIYVLLPPKSPSGGQHLPGMLALHGHGIGGYDTVAGRDDIPELREEIASQRADYGRQLARRGYAVAVPCMTPFGRRLSPDVARRPKLIRDVDPCADTFVRLAILGKLLIAENLRDILWTLAYLSSREEVDADRVGCAGLSYGGRMTMLSTALEPRIRVAVIAGAMNCFQERIGRHYTCGSQTIPGLLPLGDVPEIGGLIAPRPCMWQVGSQDKLLPPQWVDTIEQRIDRVYRALGVADRVQIDRFTGKHEWHGAAAYPFLDRILRPAV
ncbi:MAG TPA: prolyl oligopeptidase family serine peptidase [Pirellulales bacterium]